MRGARRRAIVAAGAGAGVADAVDAGGRAAALARRDAELRHRAGLPAPADALPLLARAAPALAVLPPRRVKSATLRRRRVDVRARGARRAGAGGARPPPAGRRARAVAGEDRARGIGCASRRAGMTRRAFARRSRCIAAHAWERASPRERVAIVVAAVVVVGVAWLGVRLAADDARPRAAARNAPTPRATLVAARAHADDLAALPRNAPPAARGDLRSARRARAGRARSARPAVAIDVQDDACASSPRRALRCARRRARRARKDARRLRGRRHARAARRARHRARRTRARALTCARSREPVPSRAQSTARRDSPAAAARRRRGVRAGVARRPPLAAATDGTPAPRRCDGHRVARRGRPDRRPRRAGGCPWLAVHRRWRRARRSGRRPGAASVTPQARSMRGDACRLRNVAARPSGNGAGERRFRAVPPSTSAATLRLDAAGVSLRRARRRRRVDAALGARARVVVQRRDRSTSAR